MTRTVAIAETISDASPGPRVLTDNEIDQVSGGALPLIGFGLALAGKLTAAGPVTWAIGSGSLILGTYEAAKYLQSHRFGDR